MIDTSEYDDDEDYKKALEEVYEEFGKESSDITSEKTNNSFCGGAGGNDIITVYY
jgi:hypothetical protein